MIQVDKLINIVVYMLLFGVLFGIIALAWSPYIFLFLQFFRHGLLQFTFEPLMVLKLIGSLILVIAVIFPIYLFNKKYWKKS